MKSKNSITAADFTGLFDSIQDMEDQKSFVKDNTLPTFISCCGNYNAKEILEAAGMKFLGTVPGNPIFQCVELPAGWQKVSTDHTMWFKLLDECGRERGNIFFRSSLFGRKALMTLVKRYEVVIDYDLSIKEGALVSSVVDCGKVIHTNDPVPLGNHGRIEITTQMEQLIYRWLDENFPKWQNPGAYWD